MKIRLLTFVERVGRNEAESLDSIDKWHARANQSRRLSESALHVDGQALLSNGTGELRLLFICDNGNAAIDLSLDPDDTEHLMEILDEGRMRMAEISLEKFVENISSEEAQEITDVIGGMMMDAGGTEPAES
jgi:hypothetical protein